jgi:hypothetical protein
MWRGDWIRIPAPSHGRRMINTDVWLSTANTPFASRGGMVAAQFRPVTRLARCLYAIPTRGRHDRSDQWTGELAVWDVPCLSRPGTACCPLYVSMCSLDVNITWSVERETTLPMLRQGCSKIIPALTSYQLPSSSGSTAARPLKIRVQQQHDKNRKEHSRIALQSLIVQMKPEQIVVPYRYHTIWPKLWSNSLPRILTTIIKDKDVNLCNIMA